MLTNSNKSDICDLLRTIQKDYTLARVAEDLDKKSKTWQVELSPYDDNHKLGLFDVLNTLFITKKPFPFLQFVCDLFDHHAAPNAKKSSPRDIHRTITQITRELGDVAQVYLEAVDLDSVGREEIKPEEQSRILKEATDLKHVVNQLEACLKG